MRYRIATTCEIAAGLRDVNIHVHIHLYFSNIMFTQILLRDVLTLVVCFASRRDCFSLSRLPSRLGADTTSTPAAAAAAAVAGLDSTKGSAPGVPSGSTHSPSHQRMRWLRPSRSRSLSLSPCLHSLVVPRALSALHALNFYRCPLFNEALL